jgi:hypothetical protein
MTANDQWDRNDHYYERAYRDASHFSAGPLNAIEQMALMHLIPQWHNRPLADRDIAAIPLLREDGAAQLVPLTISLVEYYAAAVYERESWTAEQFTFPAP